MKRRKKLEAEGEVPKRKHVVGLDGRKRKAEKSTDNLLSVGQPVEAQAAPDLTPAKFVCPECQDVFTEEVWHCPVCVHHWGLEDDDHTRHITPT